MLFAYEGLVFAIHGERNARIAKLTSLPERPGRFSLRVIIGVWLIRWGKVLMHSGEKWAAALAS